LHAGDKLLAIDVLKTDNLSIEEAARVLTNVEDIVKLRIRKDEPTPGKNLYSVIAMHKQKLLANFIIR
jgi:hypothetical protein